MVAVRRWVVADSWQFAPSGSRVATGPRRDRSGAGLNLCETCSWRLAATPLPVVQAQRFLYACKILYGPGRRDRSSLRIRAPTVTGGNSNPVAKKRRDWRRAGDPPWHRVPRASEAGRWAGRSARGGGRGQMLRRGRRPDRDCRAAMTVPTIMLSLNRIVSSVMTPHGVAGPPKG